LPKLGVSTVSDQTKKFADMLEKLALEAVTLESDDVQGLGHILNTVSAMQDVCRDWQKGPLQIVLQAVVDYVERLVLRQAVEIAPLEEGIVCLQSIYRAIQSGDAFTENIAPILQGLGYEDVVPVSGIDQPDDGPGQDAGGAQVGARVSITSEEAELLNEFAAESLENLETIEVNLIQLEEHQDDFEIIDAIFRPFHTIKGVSGFLNLDKINRLAHVVESLLDKGREGKIQINEAIVDIVLESVDMLTNMLLEVQRSAGEGVSQDLEAFRSEDLVERITELEMFENIGSKSLGEILVERGDLSREVLKTGLGDQEKAPDKRIGEILLEKKAVRSKEIISALRDQKRFGKRNGDLNIKVDTKKLDTLVEMTGELVIAHSILRRNMQQFTEKDHIVYTSMNQIHQITSTLQKTTMSMRMIPIKSTFQKMVRLVRELSKASGKEVELKMKGADTEIDRSMVDELYEPMVHMIRNAIDHGLEEPQERESAGKGPRGRIELRATHRGGNLVIEIEDDGRGIDKNGILEKAIARNLIEADHTLADSEIYDLIFHPGFSTAKEVTEVSGRGVGMDVVKRAVEKLLGRIEIISTRGKKSTIIIRLPLTLAIMDGILVRVGSEKYIIPTLSMLETFAPKEDQYFTIHGKGEMIDYRGELVPLIRLARIFEDKKSTTNPWEALVVAITHDGKKRFLLIDEIIGKEEVVIKSIGEHLKNTKGVAGCTIMGDGKVGLILDIPDIIEISQS
jgi:two-component system chemotaxis sensor kinase CheA